MSVSVKFNLRQLTRGIAGLSPVGQYYVFLLLRDGHGQYGPVLKYLFRLNFQEHESLKPYKFLN